MSNNKYLELPEATDNEAQMRRDRLIKLGVISTNITQQRENQNMSPEEIRSKLIQSGVIKPVEKLKDGRVTYCDLPQKLNIKSTNNEEGEYRVKPIVSESDYERKKMVYFRSLQELLFARRHLNLIVGKKEENDPEWFF
jgi:hypothetical protein